MSLKLAARLVALQPAKILDLQENDTAAHVEDISAFVPPETIAIIIVIKLISGTGPLILYPSSAAFNTDVANLVTIPIKNQELKWVNSVANDDYDIYLVGYFVQKRTR